MKTNEYTTPPPAPEHLPNGEGALYKAAIGAHRAVDKVAGAADDVARKAVPGVDRVAELAHHAVDKAAAAAAPAADWLDEQARALDATQKKLVGNTREYVAANPLMSLGMALAAGFLLSRIFRK